MKVNPSHLKQAFQRAGREGAALIWCLLLCGCMAVMCLTFLSVSTSSRKSAGHGLYSRTADEALDAAKQEILAKLTEGFAVETGVGSARQGHAAASPGLLEVRRYDVKLNRGSQRGAAAFEGSADSPAPFSQPFSDSYSGQPANPRWIPLFSWQHFAPRLKHLMVNNGAASSPNPDYNPALAFNINTPSNPFSPGKAWLSGVAQGAEVMVRERHEGEFAGQGSDQQFRLSTGQSAGERPVWVQWIPILKNPSEAPSEENPMIARYAYWVDVENTKLRVDQPLRGWRDQPQFVRLAGEPDAVEQPGAASWFSQGDQNSARLIREGLEKSLPVSKGGGDENSYENYLSRDGAGAIGFAPAVAQEAREAWLGWLNGNPPPMADARLVDWDFFEVPWPKEGEAFTIASMMKNHASQWAGDDEKKPLFAWLLGSDSRGADTDEQQRIKTELLHQGASSAFTFYGHEEELDPLGRPKLDIVAFQLDATAGRTSPVSLSAIQGSALWSRLADAAYYNAYYPGAWPTGGTARSFLSAWNRFAGDGSTGNVANGAAAVSQMLVNTAEFAQPDTVPPLIDTASGIVGARSMPYVAEVTTRMRSAFWLLPEADRLDESKLLKKTGSGAFSYTYSSRRLQHYANHVVVDLAIGLVNPNPFETKPFEGTLELDIAWGPLPTSVVKHTGTLPDNIVTPCVLQSSSTTPVSLPIRGYYNLTPEPHKDTKAAQAQGNTLYVRLGVLPVSFLQDTEKFATALQIKGWRIKRSDGSVWHQVPVRHPGGKSTRDWWAMAQIGQNAGKPSDPWSLAAYQDTASPYYRSVGWFCEDTMNSLLAESLYVSDWPTSAASSSDEDLTARVITWAERASRTAVLERVISLDPVLGHRTGDQTLSGLYGRGHFYGMLGHTWRRYRSKAGTTELGVTGLGVRAVVGRSWTYQKAATQQMSARVRRASNDQLSVTAQSWDVPQWTAVPLSEEIRGEYYHGEDETGMSEEELAIKERSPESLTGMYVAPSVQGPAPQGKVRFDDGFKDALKLKNAGLENMDLEVYVEPVEGAGDFVKNPDGTKGPRSFVSSAPAGRPFVSVGEMGFCHSGFVQTPIMVGPDEGRTEYQINSPLNGPPMRMLLDMFRAVRFSDEDGDKLSQTQWLSGQGNHQAERHAWNVNTTVAHDDYMALRQGGNALAELKKEVDPSGLPARVVWLPNAQGFARRAEGSEAFRGKEAKHIVEKAPGYLQDRHLRPFPVLSRPWDMWMSVIGGDISPARSGESLLWGVGNSAALYYGPGFLTWKPGKGSGATDDSPWVDFKSDVATHGRLLTFGVDGRKDADNDKDGMLKGRFASDQNMDAFGAGLPYYVPAHFATRFSLYPMRHFISDLAVDFHQENHESEWMRLKTALNPGISADPLPDPTDDGAEDKELKTAAEKLDGAGYPGGWNRSGVFYHAPMTLLTNQAGVSANVFSAYIAVQTLRDRGTVREGVEKSGYGYSDPEDEVLAQSWARVIIAREPDPTGSAAPRFRILATEVADK